MSAPDLASVPERDATGEVAELYADIRETLGLPVVNLIWRHFATLDGGLAWAWGTLRPLYTAGDVHAAGGRLLTGLALPALPRVPDTVLAGAGVDPSLRPTLCAVLDTYDRGNALNICALSALLATAPCAPASGGTGQPPSRGAVPPAADGRAARRHAPGDGLPPPPGAVPPVPELSDLPPAVRDLVWTANTLGQAPGDATLATLWRHLAIWPGALSVAWSLLAPLDADGRLRAANADTVRRARAEAAALAAGRPAAPEPPAAAAVRRAAEHFVQHVIGRMIPAGLLLRGALG